MNIKVNGEIIEIEENLSLIQFLQNKNIPEKKIIIEKNKTILSDLNAFLKEGDVLEIIRLVGGG